MTPVAVHEMAEIVKAFVAASGPGGDMAPLGQKLYDYVMKNLMPKPAPVIEAAPEPVAEVAPKAPIVETKAV